MNTVKQEKSKYIQVADLIKGSIQTEQLQRGDRLQSMRSLAKKLDVSLKSVQYGFDLLEKEGVVERRAGSGTFVKNLIKDEVSSLKLLLPVADMTLTPSRVQAEFVQYQNGIIADMKNSEVTSMELVAISNSNKYGDINKKALDRINEGDKLIIDGSWFVPIMKYIAEKNCEVVYFSAEYLLPENAQITSKWHCFYFSIPEAYEKIVMHLSYQGYERIVLCKPYHEDEEDYPLQYSSVKSYRAALDDQGMENEDAFYTPYTLTSSASILRGDELRDYIVNLWNETKFDSIIIYGLIDVPELLNILQHELGLAVPQDVGLVYWGDAPELSFYSTPITTLNLPCFEMGKAASNILLSDRQQPTTSFFSTKLTLRESTNRLAK